MAKEDEEEVTGGEIAAALARLTRLIRTVEHDDGLNPTQWEALRYLARANRFSKSPSALSRYFGTTRGTVSQTLLALVRKGLASKARRQDEKRQVVFALTPKGEETLGRDPWARLATAADALSDKTRRRMGRGASELLAQELARGQHAGFGVCSTCRFFRQNLGGEPHQCMLFELPLSQDDSTRICFAHRPSM
jgi:DNA-binding MarR family transcriptional regulator